MQRRCVSGQKQGAKADTERKEMPCGSRKREAESRDRGGKTEQQQLVASLVVSSSGNEFPSGSAVPLLPELSPCLFHKPHLIREHAWAVFCSLKPECWQEHHFIASAHLSARHVVGPEQIFLDQMDQVNKLGVYICRPIHCSLPAY